MGKGDVPTLPAYQFSDVANFSLKPVTSLQQHSDKNYAKSCSTTLTVILLEEHKPNSETGHLHLILSAQDSDNNKLNIVPYQGPNFTCGM